jgi:hypothetical protein
MGNCIKGNEKKTRLNHGVWAEETVLDKGFPVMKMTFMHRGKTPAGPKPGPGR